MADLWKQVSITSFTLGLLYSFMGNVKSVMRLEVFTVVLLMIQVFWYVAWHCVLVCGMALCSGMWCGTVFWYVAWHCVLGGL
jgi:hypothetical protein